MPASEHRSASADMSARAAPRRGGPRRRRPPETPRAPRSADARRVGLARAALIPKPDADRVRRLATLAAAQGAIGAGDQPIELAEAGIAANGDLVGVLGLRAIETRGRGGRSGRRSRHRHRGAEGLERLDFLDLPLLDAARVRLAGLAGAPMGG